ncbi:transcription factor jumonji (JmjC) domain protein, partial [Trifolium medium]|nr:transcription factor jumonji (JmjC) domain protein [Trifolium medium]
LDVAAETVPFKVDDVPQTVNVFVVAETVSLNDGEGKGSVKDGDVTEPEKEEEESVPDREKQAMNIDAETTSLKDV